MTNPSTSTQKTKTANESGAVLESWKEIAVHLRRDVSTVRRWEKYERLPVRRHHHLSRASVYAYAA